MRRSYNGIITAFQADNVGSIPTRRSIESPDMQRLFKLDSEEAWMWLIDNSPLRLTGHHELIFIPENALDHLVLRQIRENATRTLWDDIEMVGDE